MVMVKAKGKKNQKELEILVVDGVTFVDDVEEDMYDFELHAANPIGGTYYPEPKSMENILNNLSNHFFDNRPKIETEGTFEEIPYVEGRIY